MTNQRDSAAAVEGPVAAYVAPPGYEDVLAEDLARSGRAPVRLGHRLFLADGEAVSTPWAANIWFDPRRMTIASIKDGARQLRAMQRNWALHPIAHHGRARLIAEALPHVSARPIAFPAAAPTAPLGSWTLLDGETILAAPTCSSPFPDGAPSFVEDRTGPPSRAYLKLWEAFTVLREWPRVGEHCLDLGAAPGGWTWVLAALGARVTSVDKAALDPSVASRSNVRHLEGSAFGIEPDAFCADHGAPDWVFSDVICYPDRLFRMAERWRESGLVRRMICTIKFQGATDFDAVRRFQAVSGSRVLHLHQNKHELTWIWIANASGDPM